ncbi:uncharacterized protein LOC128861733 isoform X2 [Anastrepha ludens]|uniref:uncharacterized protein LOC128861733 isoform X2 n=1 Tax=Anastrepha ludens TaxID=28586 RepID=UPI0023AE9B15|nr:uncharacterized protein LOC128861733 isoform X2 [Anastrepha ludens]XP_053956074.1 uncharacterized protein LOC128861733 isoform X2 [Anastrepha ludens]
MSKKLPMISVTKDDQSESSEDSNSNDMDYNYNAGDATDIEDFDSQGDIKNLTNSKASINTISIPQHTKHDTDATDIEDYNDTDSEEDDNSNVYPVLKLSLQEFLQHGLREQSMIDNEANERVENKSGNFLQAQNLNEISDYLTDCEDYNTDSELENACEKSVCFDLDTAVNDQGKVCIADHTLPSNENEHSDEYEDLSAMSDVSEIASGLSDVAGTSARRISECEVLELSGEEEECQIVLSDSASENDEDDIIYDSASNASLPPIDVAFISTGGQQRRKSTTMSANKNAFLTVAGERAHTEEALTDVEKFDDSAAEDCFDSEEEEKPIPRAVVLTAAGDDSGDLTDEEDIFYDDVTQSTPDIPSMPDAVIPPPHREMVVLKENQFGDIIENVMPMDREHQFGIYNAIADDVQTEDEEYSCADDFEQNSSVAECLHAETLIEGEVIVLNETLKPQPSKRLELHSNTESVTDVEEIYVDGTNRRKKLKARTASKGKIKLLDVARGNEDGGTDIEDMELSERGLPSNVKLNANERQPQDASFDKNTDIEDISVDEVSDMSDTEAKCDTDVGSSTLKDYIVSNRNIVVTIETDSQRKSSKNHVQRCKIQTLTLHDACAGGGTNPPNTDVEDLQCPSDIDDASGDNVAAEAPACNCNDLTELLNESYTVVHEKNSNSFNIEAEKLHIKCNAETRDAHTDIEYVESDESAARGSN